MRGARSLDGSSGIGAANASTPPLAQWWLQSHLTVPSQDGWTAGFADSAQWACAPIDSPCCISID
jgi:hypothetical protein